MDKCDKCGGEARVHFTDVGDFCNKCANELTLENLSIEKSLGIEKVPEKSRIIVVIDSNNVAHSFESDYLLLGSLIKWSAEEQTVKGRRNQTHYSFEILSDTDEDQSEAFQRLKDKVVKGVSEKSLNREKEKPYLTNALHRKQQQYSLKEQGQFNISTDNDGNNIFVIDGIDVTPAEFADMLSAYEGFTLYYDIRDSSE